MHTSDTIDYGIVVRGEMTLELDDGQRVHLRQGDCVVQNGTRHRWRNPLPEPCLMAFISIGGKRGLRFNARLPSRSTCPASGWSAASASVKSSACAHRVATTALLS